MQRIATWRLVLIGAVTLLCLLFVWPSVRYFLALRTDDPLDGLHARVRFFEHVQPDELADQLRETGMDVESVEQVTAIGDFDYIIRTKIERTAEEATASAGLRAARASLTDALGEAYGADSFEIMQARSFWKKHLEELREKTFFFTHAITLGLDLRGGVDVTLVLDESKIAEKLVKDIVLTLNGEFSNDHLSAEAGEDETDPVKLWVELADESDAREVYNILGRYENNGQLTGDYSQQDLAALKRITLEVDPEGVRADISDNIEGALRVVRERLNARGLEQPSIARQEDQIRVQMPGEEDPAKLIDILTRLAHLEFRLTHEKFGQFDDPLLEILDENGELRRGARPPVGFEIMDYKFGEWDSTTGQIVYPPGSTGKMLVEKEVRLDGSNLRSTGVIRVQLDLRNPIQVELRFDAEGSDIFARMTQDSVSKMKSPAGRSDRLAIILDDVVFSAPVMEQIITGGSALISGGFSFDEARDLSLILKAGSLPAPLSVESQYTVGATLGTESILSGIGALGWGTLFVIVFMIFYYRMAGVIAIFALVLNVLLIFGIMSLADATLTLSGIGGILLTVGMAVDANVLIYERIREEIDAGRPLRQAISMGFDRAFTVILDSNLTTLMTALVLLQFTQGSIRGFALTLTFGLLANLYTGLTVTHTLCAFWFQWRDKLSLGNLRPFSKTFFDFIKVRFFTWGLSGAMILVGIVAVVARGGLQFGVDFAGGLLAEVRFTEPDQEERLRQMLIESGLEGERVQEISGSNDYLIRVKVLENEEAQQVGQLTATLDLLMSGLVETYGEDGFEILDTKSFGPETGQGFRSMAVLVIILASLAILAYLWVRFELVFGVAAVIALIHDLVFTLLWSSVWNVEITLDVVAALMVLLGFSVNDTIVVFDRIRENGRRLTEKSFKEICNISMNQSLSRTLITSGTAVLVIGVMLLIGGSGLHPFAKVLIIGTLIGTYSSDFVAAPIVYEWNKYRKGKLAAALAAKRKSGPADAPKPPGIADKSGTSKPPSSPGRLKRV